MKAFPNMAGQQGMDLRDYFAAKAMPSAMQWLEQTYNQEMEVWSWDAEDAEEIATVAYMMADAMIKAREEE